MKMEFCRQGGYVYRRWLAGLFVCFTYFLFFLGGGDIFTEIEITSVVMILRSSNLAQSICTTFLHRYGMCEKVLGSFSLQS